jgi:hypothetical protein
MIQINLSNSKKKKIESLHYNAIYTNLGKKKSLNKAISDQFGFKYTLKDFLIGDSDKLKEILVDYKNLSATSQREFKSVFTPYFLNQYEQKLAVTPKKSENIYMYQDEKYNAYTLCQMLDINICPYCNKNAIVTIADSDNNVFTRPTLDHFLDKTTYPFFALSLYNLIPSCHICNSHIKGSTPFEIDTHIHPYFDDFNKIKEFGVDNILLSLVHKESDFKIVFKDKENISSSEKIKADNHIKDFGLEILYASHKDKVLELVDFSRAYNEDTFKNLVNTFKDSTEIFKDTNDVKRLLLGHHIENENIDKRPLNKLVKDISEQLGLLK